jgi:hypothetical protein
MINIKEEFCSLKKIYHYTTFQTALKILKSKSLRFGRMNGMNDIHENDKQCFVDDNKEHLDSFSSEVLEALQNELFKYRQISFSIDEEGKVGFDLHQMWGLYADKGNGVCLVFDKDELERKLDANIVSNKVSYNEQVDSYVVSISDGPNNVPDEVSSNVLNLFFHKRKEWEHEQEFRLIKRCPVIQKEEYIPCGDALKYIIMSSKLLNEDDCLFNQRIQEIKLKRSSCA